MTAGRFYVGSNRLINKKITQNTMSILRFILAGTGAVGLYVWFGTRKQMKSDGTYQGNKAGASIWLVIWIVLIIAAIVI